MTAFEAHLDVASYALGILDAHDVARFEEHLVTCDACAAELESLLPVTQTLAEIDRDSFFKADRTIRDGQMLDRMRDVVALERRRGRLRSIVGLGAAAGVAVGATLSLAIGPFQPSGPGGVVAGPSSSSTGASPYPTGSESTPQGPGTANNPPGTRHDAVSPSSGVTLEAYVDGRSWGSQLTVL